MVLQDAPLRDLGAAVGVGTHHGQLVQQPEKTTTYVRVVNIREVR